MTNFIITPFGFLTQTVNFLYPIPCFIIIKECFRTVFITHRKNLILFPIAIEHCFVTYTAIYSHLAFFIKVLCLIGISISQGLKDNASPVVILIFQVCHFCLVYRLNQISIPIILVVGNALIHMYHIR